MSRGNRWVPKTVPKLLSCCASKPLVTMVFPSTSQSLLSSPHAPRHRLRISDRQTRDVGAARNTYDSVLRAMGLPFDAPELAVARAPPDGGVGSERKQRV